MRNRIVSVIVLCAVTIALTAIAHNDSILQSSVQPEVVIEEQQTFIKPHRILKSHIPDNNTQLILNIESLDKGDKEGVAVETVYAEEEIAVETVEEAIAVEEVETTEENAVETIETPYTPITGINNASQSVINYANTLWQSTPQLVKDKIIESGYNIYITGENLEDVWGYSYGIAALTVYGEKAVYIENSNNQVKRAFFHELGHVTDHIYNSPSCTTEFQDIFNAEQSNFHDYSSIGDGNETSCLTEYFASVFDNVINNSTVTQQEIHLSYEYVSRFIY